MTTPSLQAHSQSNESPRSRNRLVSWRLQTAWRASLHGAAVNGRVEAVAGLLRHYLSKWKDGLAYTPLRAAGKMVRENVVELLLSRKTLLRTRSQQALKRWQDASQAGSARIAELLLAAERDHWYDNGWTNPDVAVGRKPRAQFKAWVSRPVRRIPALERLDMPDFIRVSQDYACGITAAKLFFSKCC